MRKAKNMKVILLAAMAMGAFSVATAAEREPMKYPETVRQMPQLKGVMLGNSTEREFIDLHAMGATLVRYQMHAQWATFAATTNAFAAFDAWFGKQLDHLEELLPIARRYGIRICVDQHTHFGGFTDEQYNSDMIFVEKKYEDLLVETWQRIARRFKGNWDVIYGYDLLNEPINRENRRIKRSWHDVFCRTIEAVRAIDPEATIVVEPNCHASPRGFDVKNPYGLKGVDLLPYDNLIYSVHVYLPMDFTHQGLSQKKDAYKPIPYPNPEKGWDKAFVRKEIQSVRDFQLKTGVRIFVGEFSAAVYAPGGDRYVNDLCELFAEYGWDWTYHAFREAYCWSFEYTGASYYELKPATAETPRKAILKRHMKSRQCGKER